MSPRAPRRPRPAPVSPAEAARALALRVLAFHGRTEAQLRARLARAGHGGAADDVIGWLRRLGYLDDAAYARTHARLLIGRLAPRAAERRLRAAGVAPAIASGAVRDAAEDRAAGRAPGETAELALCRAALRRRLRGADPGALDDRDRARLARFLLGRGFSGEVVARVVGPREGADG